MPIRELIPSPIKHLFRQPYYFFRRRWLYAHPKPIETIHDYWQHPDDANDPRKYLTGRTRSKWLVGILEKYVPKEGSLLELGCNVGRNLNEAYQAGYRNLEAIEINPEAIEILRQSYPAMASAANIHLGRIEDNIQSIASKSCILTMAVLVHIHPASEWIFSEMAKRAKTLIVIEAENDATWRHFARDYKKIFEGFGMRQLEEINCNEVPELKAESELQTYVARVFQRA
jgi:SAM-dependent methyltransferase